MKRQSQLRELTDAEARFWAKVTKDGPVPSHRPELGPCYRWHAAKNKGYGVIGVGGRNVEAHKFAYELANGPVPEGLTLDHLCHNGSGCQEGRNCPHRACTNQTHMEAVPPGENVLRGEGPSAQAARQTHCVNGHEFTEENTWVNPKLGHRHCRTCWRQRKLSDVERTRSREAKRRQRDDPESREKYNAYMREYQRARRARQREAGVA